MQKPPKQSVELTVDQCYELGEFFEYCQHEAAAGRKGVLLAQVGHPNPGAMVVNFIPHDMAVEMKVVMKRLGYFDDSSVSEEG